MIFVAVLAGGIGSRMGDTDTPKQFLNLGDRPILIHTIEKFVIMDEIDEVIVLTPQNFINHTKHLIEEYTPNNDKIVVIEGGKTRNDTLKNSIDYIYENYSVDDDSIIKNFCNNLINSDNLHFAVSNVAFNGNHLFNVKSMANLCFDFFNANGIMFNEN